MHTKINELMESFMHIKKLFKINILTIVDIYIFRRKLLPFCFLCIRNQTQTYEMKVET